LFIAGKKQRVLVPKRKERNEVERAQELGIHVVVEGSERKKRGGVRIAGMSCMVKLDYEKNEDQCADRPDHHPAQTRRGREWRGRAIKRTV